jgi:hypothetical protein
MSPPELSGHPANSSRSPNKALPGAPSIAQFAVILVSLKERQ